jgi:hypothetical protein
LMRDAPRLKAEYDRQKNKRLKDNP